MSDHNRIKIVNSAHNARSVTTERASGAHALSIGSANGAKKSDSRSNILVFVGFQGKFLYRFHTTQHFTKLSETSWIASIHFDIAL